MPPAQSPEGGAVLPSDLGDPTGGTGDVVVAGADTGTRSALGTSTTGHCLKDPPV